MSHNSIFPPDSECLKEIAPELVGSAEELLTNKRPDNLKNIDIEEMQDFKCDFSGLGCPAVLEIYRRIKTGQNSEITKIDEVDFSRCWKERR